MDFSFVLHDQTVELRRSERGIWPPNRHRHAPSPASSATPPPRRPPPASPSAPVRCHEQRPAKRAAAALVLCVDHRHLPAASEADGNSQWESIGTCLCSTRRRRGVRKGGGTEGGRAALTGHGPSRSTRTASPRCVATMPAAVSVFSLGPAARPRRVPLVSSASPPRRPPHPWRCRHQPIPRLRQCPYLWWGPAPFNPCTPTATRPRQVGPLAVRQLPVRSRRTLMAGLPSATASQEARLESGGGGAHKGARQ